MSSLLCFMLGVVIALLIYALWSYYIEYRITHYAPTEKDLANERVLMELEKKHFGHYTTYYERQTKEYEEWFNSGGNPK